MPASKNTLSADQLRVLVLAPTTADAEAIVKLFAVSNIACETFGNMSALCAAFRDDAGVLMIAEESLTADFDALARCIQNQPVWSDIPIILLSRSGAESAAMTQAVQRIANVSVIERPVRVTTLVSLTRSSLRARARQFQVRDHLAERERSEQTIREGEQRYRLLIENVKDYAIFMIDVNGNVASWNEGAETILGYSSDEILNQSAEILFTPEDRANGTPLREMDEARRTGRATDMRWHLRKHNERFFVDGVMTAVYSDAGELLGFSKLMKDVTEQHRIESERESLLKSERAARSEAERAGRMKDEFLATLSHELRTPLNAILGWSQLLRGAPGQSEDMQEGLAVIDRNARSQSQIIEDLLDMSRIISGKVRLEMQRVDLAAQVESAVETVSPAADAKGVRLQVELDPNVPTINADPNRLQQVLWNLLNNAVKFTSKSGAVTVRMQCVASQIRIDVSDTGEGIAPEFLPFVFDRFRQADASTTRRYGGLGLGLSIVKQIIEMHGGTIAAASAGKGAGASFGVTLPIAAANIEPLSAKGSAYSAPHSANQALADAKLPSLEGISVLVIDDENDARTLLRRLLSDCKAQVSIAATVEEAIVQLEVSPPNVWISDISMPGEDGYSLIARVRALPADRGRDTPAIALTAYARSEDRTQALAAGFDYHVAKPVEPAVLISTIAALAARR